MHKSLAKIIQYKYELSERTLHDLEEMILNMGARFYSKGYYDASNVLLTQEESKHRLENAKGENFHV